MGLFGSRKDAGKDGHSQDSVVSPKEAIPKRSRSRMPHLGHLFSDAPGDASKQKGTSPDSAVTNNVEAPTIDMDDVELSTTVMVQSLAQVQKSSDIPDDTRRKLTSVPSAHHVNQVRGMQSLSRQNSILRRASSISRMTQRDSIKRSVSRKIARSESRRQGFNDGATQNAGTGNNSVPFPTGSSEEESELLSPRLAEKLSLCDDEYKSSDKKNAEGRDFEAAYEGEDFFLVEEATRKDFDEESVRSGGSEGSGDIPLPVDANQQVVSASPTGNQSPENSPSPVPQPLQVPKPAKARKRPPPLVGTNTEKSTGDSTSDFPHTTVFGKDGGFVTRGFTITSEGMVGKPELTTRQDSDPEGEDDLPPSEQKVIFVRSLKEFRAGPTIGAGAGGRVYLAEHVPSQRTMAMKVVNVYDREKRNQLLKELQTLCTHISHYLVRFYGAFYDGSGAVHIALEFMDHGCLSTFVQQVGAIPEAIVQMIAVDCLRGLRFLHRNHVLHRDFKTANILLSRRLCCAKLSDFGLARDLDAGVSRVETFVGTVAYMSPERLQGSKYTYASDIWALGVSIAECLLGRYPFNRPQNYFDYIEATMTSNIWSAFDELGVQISEEAKSFITQCTHSEPTKRPNSEELLEHPWLAGMKKDKDMFGSWLDKCRIMSMRATSTNVHK